MRYALLFFLAAMVLGLAAVLGAADDTDFFNPADFFDMTGLHHEHLVVLAGLAALLFLAMSAFLFVTEIGRA